MPLDLKAHLKALCQAHGPSAYEGEVRALLREAWAPYTDEMQVNPMGSLMALKRGEGPETRRRLMVTAHMDEIAMMVSRIQDGYLQARSMSGVDARILQAKPVLVHGRELLRGVFAAVPPHISRHRGDKGKNHYPALEEQWIDLGLPAEEVAAKVQVGDVITLDEPAVDLKGDLITAKALDNRASLAALTYTLELLQKRRHDWDIYFVATTQEEKTQVGARTATYALNPDLAIVLDVAFAKQPGVNGDSDLAPGKGFTIGLGPNFRPQLAKRLTETAKALELPHGQEVLAGVSGTEAWPMQIMGRGLPVALMSLPIRNMHTGAETMNLLDIKRAGRLLAEFISQLDGQTLDDLAWDLTATTKKDEDED
jgi:endoglucanase